MNRYIVVGYYDDADPGDPAGHYISHFTAADPEAAIRGAYLEADGGPLVVICAISPSGGIHEPS